MTDYNPNNANERNFDPSVKARLDYKKAGMSKSQYKVLQNRWIKGQAAAEGKEYKTWYTPKGYSSVWSTESGQKPGTVYWKPEAYARYRADLPQMEWDTSKDIQNYWHNPTNVVSWINRLRAQDDDYEPPEWIDKQFINDQYSALKDYNSEEDDPLYWKPLPFGNEAAYATSFAADPNGNIPVYDSIIKQITQGEGAAARLRRQVELAEMQFNELKKEEEAKAQAWLTEVNTAPDAATVVSKLSEGVGLGYVDQSVVDDSTKYFQEQGLYPLEDGSFLKAPDVQPEGGDYLNLYPWQRFVQTVGGQVAMENQPELSKVTGQVVGAALPAVGIWGMGNMLLNSIIALKTTGTLIGAATTAKAAIAGATVLGVSAAPVVAAGLAVLGIGTFAYLMANKNNPNNSVVQSIFRAMNQGAEVPERIMGAINVASEVRERGDEVDWSAAYDAGYMQYEMEGQPFGNFLFNTASLISEGIDRVGLMFGKDWDLSSGETATGNEIWDISKGYAEPREAEINLGEEGMLLSYDSMLALGDERTRDELEQEWAYLTSLTGTGGTWADFMGQSFVDFTNLIPAGMDAGAAKYADDMSRKAAVAGQALPARAWNTLAEKLRANIGNPLVDALPMGVQWIAENILKGWDSRVDWMTQTKLLQTNLDYKAWKAENPTRIVSKWARGTTGLPDALHGYMAHMATGYEMPNSQQFFVSPGGRVADTISFEVSSDGTLDIYNIDGSTRWHYTPDMLDKIDVKLFTDKDGKLVVVGATRLLKDMKLDNSGINDTLPTTLSWNKPIDPDTGQPMPDPVTIDATNIEYGKVTEDGNHYTARIGDRQYVVTRGTDYVTRMFDENNNEIPIDKPMRMSEHAQFLGDDVMTPDQVQIVHDMIVMTGQNYARVIPTDYKSAKEMPIAAIREHLTALKIPGVDKIIKGLQQAADLTPGTKAMLEMQNAVQTLQILFYFSGNNFELTMNGLKKMIGAVQVGRVSKAAEAFLGSGTMTAVAAAGLKNVLADGSLLDVFVDLYKDTRVDRATLTKIAKSLDVKPEKMLDMKAEDIFSKLKNKLAPKKDDVSRQIMQSIADGTMTAAKIDELLQKYTGKNAMPLTDQGFLASVSMAMEKKLQDFLIEKYGVKKLPVWERLSGMKKAMLSPFLIAFPYTTWMNNLYSNIGAQFFLTGRVPLQGKSGMEKIAKAIGLENMPIEYSSRMGLASDVMDTVNKISLTMNPMDNIGTLTRKIRNFGGAIKAYSAIEKYNTASLFVQQVIDLHSRILLPKIPDNIRRDYLAKGGTDQQLNYYMHIMNGKMNATDTLNAFIEGVEYDAVDQGLFEDVGKRIFPNDPDNAKLYQDLTEKLFKNDDFVEALKKIEEPDDLDSLVDIVTKSFEDQIDLMQVNGALETINETQNIYTKEGMAGGISVFTNMLTDEFATRYRNSASWGEAKAKADLAAKAGEYGLHDRIIRAQREKSNRVFARAAVRIESFAKGLVDALKPGDEYARRFMDVVTNRHKSSSELMKKIQSGYDNYFDARENMSVDEATRSWADLSKKNSALMDEFYKLDAQALQDLSDVFVELLGKGDPAVLSKSGLTSAELQAGGRKLMKAVMDGFKDLNKMVAEHYAGQENMSYNERIGNNLLFWNTQYQAKVVDIWSSFIDGNWQEFFKTKTDFEKGAYPETALVGETLPKAKVPTKGLSDAEKTLANSLAASEFDDAARATLEAAKVASDAKHIEQLWWRKVLDVVGEKVTDEQKAIVEAMFETYDASYTRRTGKPRGSWYVDNLKVDVIRSPEYELAGTRASGYVTPAAAITRFDVAKKVWEVTIARHSDFTTALREIDRVIFQTDLLSNVDKAIIAREFGDIDFETFIDIDSRIRNGGSVENRGITKQELMEWSKVQDGFANAHRRWLIQEAPKVATSPRMITIFQTLSTILFDLFEHIRSKINRVKMSDSVKQVFEVLHDFQNGQDAVSRNVGRMAGYPQGKPIVLNKFVRTVDTIDGVRTAEAVGVAKGVNAGIAPTLERLNGAGYKTYKSSSGMPIDYPGIEGSQAISFPKRGYISFKRSELNQNRMTRIENAAIAAGLEVYYTTRDKVLTLEVFLPVTKDLSTTAKLNAELVEKFGAKPEGAAGDAWQKKVDNYYKKLVAGHGGYLEDNGIIADLWDKFGEALVKKPKAVKGEAFQAIPKVISIDSLYSIYKIDPDTKRVSINKKFASDEYPVPPKKYTITELREMARSLDPHALLVEMRKKGTAAILVDKRGMVVDGNDTVLALLYAMRIEPDIFKRYQTQLQDVLSSYGFKKDALGDMQDGVLVMQVSEGWDRTYTELGDDVAGVSPEDMAKNTMRLIDSIDDKVYPYLYDKASLKKTIVTTADQLKTLIGLKQEILDAYKRVQALKEQGVTTSFEDHLSRLDSANRGIQVEIDKLVKFKNASDAKTPGMMQTADEVSSKSWYYHRTRSYFKGLQQKTFTADQLRARLSNVSGAEVRLLELEALIETGAKFTKDDILAWIDAHSLDIEEVEYGKPAYDADAPEGERTRYDTLNLPGGEGYRELLLTVPSWTKKYQSGHWQPQNVIAHIRFDVRIDPTTGKKVLNLLEIQSDWIQQGQKRGFKGEPDKRIMARAEKTVDDFIFRKDTDSNTYAFYHRRGTSFERKGGVIYENTDADGTQYYTLDLRADKEYSYDSLDEIKKVMKAYLTFEQAQVYKYEQPEAAPLTDFGMLALKRMLRYAVDEGFDTLTFSTGKTAAEIEGMPILKGTKTIRYHETDWLMEANDGSRTRTYPLDTDEFTLAAHIGDDIAKNVMAQPVDAEGWRTLDLSQPIDIGGEKMKPYYDETLVNGLNKYLKQWGLKLEDGEIEVATRQEFDIDKMRIPDGAEPLSEEEAFDYVTRLNNITIDEQGAIWGGGRGAEDEQYFLVIDKRLEGEGWSVDKQVYTSNELWGQLNVEGLDDAYFEIYTVDPVYKTITDNRPVHKVTFNDQLKSDIVVKGQALMQTADEVPPTRPITERPVGSEPVHMNRGSAMSELLEYDIPKVAETMLDAAKERMRAGKRETYKINVPEDAKPVLNELTAWAAEQQKLRMATILEGANRVSKDIMIDYGRKRGIDAVAETVLPFQYWYTRSMLMWMKRMVAKPSIMAMAYRYAELRRRNEMTGFPTRLGGKSLVYTPWLPDSMGDWMGVNPWSKFFTPEQLFQPLQNYASLDADVATEAQRYIYSLVQQGTVSPEAGKDAIRNKRGQIWEDAVQYTRMNTMPNETDPFTMANMFINTDPMVNALYQFSRGTPEKISPLPLTRIGNSFEAIGDGDIIGIIGAILSAPEDWAREKAGLPQAGEYGDYYVDFALSNMSTTGKYSVEEIKKAMISRQGQAFEEATRWAQQYIALRTPGTAFYKAIKDGHWKEPNVLASAFLMSFLPSGLFPDGEMELRGLKDEYNAAWSDYERGDTEALEKFNNKYPEYQTRMMMFQEPTERLRSHLINIIWDTYTKLPTANQQIAADTLGDSFKAYFLNTDTRNYDKIDERTLTTWARKLGYQAPAMPGVNEQAATDTVDPMKYYPEDTAATVQTFIDERRTKFPDYYVYQSVYFKLPEEQREAYLKKFPIVKDYWDWKDEYVKQNPVVKSYLEDRAAAADSYETEYDVEAVQGMLMGFDSQLAEDVVYYQFTGEPMKTGTKAALKALFDAAGKPGGDFNIWLQVILGE